MGLLLVRDEDAADAPPTLALRVVIAFAARLTTLFVGTLMATVVHTAAPRER